MNSSVVFVDRLLERAKKQIQFGQRIQAKSTLLHLLSFGDVEINTRIAAHRLLAELHLDAHRFRKARRHLLAALALNPNSAESYFRLAMAIDADPHGKAQRAWKLLRRAVRLNPEKANYWTGLAQVALRIGQKESASKALKRAMRIESTDLHVLNELVDAWIALDEFDVAERYLKQQRFRFGANVAFARMWERFQFARVRRDQDHRPQAILSFDSSVLAFSTEAEREIDNNESNSENNRILRHDRFSSKKTHIMRLMAHRRGPRNAP